MKFQNGGFKAIEHLVFMPQTKFFAVLPHVAFIMARKGHQLLS